MLQVCEAIEYADFYQAHELSLQTVAVFRYQLSLTELEIWTNGVPVMRTVLACTGRVSNPYRYYLRISADQIRATEADEAYVIGKRGQYTPVGAYLAGDEIIKIALDHGVQMIHPGMERL